jgi:hypothetical protein
VIFRRGGPPGRGQRLHHGLGIKLLAEEEPQVTGLVHHGPQHLGQQDRIQVRVGDAVGLHPSNASRGPVDEGLAQREPQPAHLRGERPDLLDQPDHDRVGTEALDEPHHSAADPFDRVNIRNEVGMQPFHHRLDDLLGDFGEHSLLRIEVAVEGALGHAGGRDDVRDPGLEEAPLLEHLARGAQDLTAPLPSLWGERAGVPPFPLRW